jgi:hypothetical protein
MSKLRSGSPAQGQEDSAGQPVVCAVLGRSSEALEQALAAQQQKPGTVIRHEEGLVAGLRQALEGAAEWIWVLDGSAVPRQGALAAFLEALDRVGGLPEPVLLAGVVVGPDGLVDEPRAAWYLRSGIEPAMTAAGRRLLPIRAAGGPVLVHRAALDALPRTGLAPPGGVLEWTARLLRARAGYLVPESEHSALAHVRHPLDDPRVAAALLLGGGLSGAERLSVVFDLVELRFRRSAGG